MNVGSPGLASGLLARCPRCFAMHGLQGYRRHPPYRCRTADLPGASFLRVGVRDSTRRHPLSARDRAHHRGGLPRPHRVPVDRRRTGARFRHLARPAAPLHLPQSVAADLRVGHRMGAPLPDATPNASVTPQIQADTAPQKGAGEKSRLASPRHSDRPLSRPLRLLDGSELEDSGAVRARAEQPSSAPKACDAILEVTGRGSSPQSATHLIERAKLLYRHS